MEILFFNHKTNKEYKDRESMILGMYIYIVNDVQEISNCLAV